MTEQAFWDALFAPMREGGAMVVANATEDDGTRVILLGLSRENVRRLTAGEPIRVGAESHPGFPVDLKIMIVFEETERRLVEALQAFISDDTKVIAVPREPGQVS